MRCGAALYFINPKSLIIAAVIIRLMSSIFESLGRQNKHIVWGWENIYREIMIIGADFDKFDMYDIWY